MAGGGEWARLVLRFSEEAEGGCRQEAPHPRDTYLVAYPSSYTRPFLFSCPFSAHSWLANWLFSSPSLGNQVLERQGVGPTGRVSRPEGSPEALADLTSTDRSLFCQGPWCLSYVGAQGSPPASLLRQLARAALICLQ